MSERPTLDRAGTLKALAYWSTYAGLVLAAGALMVLSKADAVLIERIRVQASDTVTPILDVASRPVDAIVGAAETAGRWLALAEENKRLRDERERLLHWHAVARRLEAENTELRKLLNAVPEPQSRFITARVIADVGGAFARSVLVNAGANAGLSKGQAVITSEGLAGRIEGVAGRSARVLLITDLNSRIPVVVEPAKTRAILAGDNSNRPRLAHVMSEEPIAPGDRVVTSGDAGALPPGLPVGVVDRVGDGAIHVRPFANADKLDHVRVVDFGLGGLLSEWSSAEPRRSAVGYRSGPSATGGGSLKP